MESAIFAPASTLNLREFIYDQIKEAIVNGLIPAGSRLSEVDLSRQFDVSRTPVREAIRCGARACPRRWPGWARASPPRY